MPPYRPPTWAPEVALRAGQEALRFLDALPPNGGGGTKAYLARVGPGGEGALYCQCVLFLWDALLDLGCGVRVVVRLMRSGGGLFLVFDVLIRRAAEGGGWANAVVCMPPSSAPDGRAPLLLRPASTSAEVVASLEVPDRSARISDIVDGLSREAGFEEGCDTFIRTRLHGGAIQDYDSQEHEVERAGGLARVARACLAEAIVLQEGAMTALASHSERISEARGGMAAWASRGMPAASCGATIGQMEAGLGELMARGSRLGDLDAAIGRLQAACEQRTRNVVAGMHDLCIKEADHALKAGMLAAHPARPLVG